MALAFRRLLPLLVLMHVIAYELGLLAAVPMALGSAGLVVIGMLLGAAGLGATALLPAEASVLTLGVCAFGLLGAVPTFWAMPTSLLTGRPAAREPTLELRTAVS